MQNTTFQICSRYARYKNRFGRLYLNYFFYLTLGAFLGAFIDGLSALYFVIYLCFLLLGILYCSILTRKILFSVIFLHDNRTVNIKVQIYNKVKTEYEISYDDFQVLLRENFVPRYKRWELKFYKKTKRVYKQNETYGWKYEDLLKIVEASKLIQ